MQQLTLSLSITQITEIQKLLRIPTFFHPVVVSTQALCCTLDDFIPTQSKWSDEISGVQFAVCSENVTVGMETKVLVSFSDSHVVLVSPSMVWIMWNFCKWGNQYWTGCPVCQWIDVIYKCLRIKKNMANLWNDYCRQYSYTSLYSIKILIFGELSLLNVIVEVEHSFCMVNPLQSLLYCVYNIMCRLYSCVYCV